VALSAAVDAFMSLQLMFWQMRDTYDVNNDSEQDLMSVHGLIAAVWMMLRVVPNGLLWGGVPCSSYIFISSATCQRKKGSRTGNVAVTSVRMGNVLCSRFCLLAMLATARSVFWLVEQPGTSCMTSYFRMAQLIQVCNQHGLFRGVARFCMGYYGAFSLKPSKVWGTMPCP
jgi:hypothetical protein